MAINTELVFSQFWRYKRKNNNYLNKNSDEYVSDKTTGLNTTTTIGIVVPVSLAHDLRHTSVHNSELLISNLCQLFYITCYSAIIPDNAPWRPNIQ